MCKYAYKTITHWRCHVSILEPYQYNIDSFYFIDKLSELTTNISWSYNRTLIEMCMIIYIDILIFVFLVTRFTLSIIQRIILIHSPCTRSYRKIYYRFYNSSTTIHVVKQPPQIIAFFTEEHRLILKIYSNILPALFSVMSTALPPIKYKSIPLYFYFFWQC